MVEAQRRRNDPVNMVENAVFRENPNLKAAGVLHWIYMELSTYYMSKTC